MESLMKKRNVVLLAIIALLVFSFNTPALAAPSWNAVTVQSGVISVPSSTAMLISINCPSGTEVSGGGVMQVQADGSDFDFVPGNSVIIGDRPNAIETGWEAVVVGGAAINHFKIYARCA